MAKSAIGQAAAAAVAERKGTPLPTPSKNTGSGGSSSGSGSSIAQAAANAVAERKQTSTTPTPLPSASTPKNDYAEQQAKLAEATRKAQQAYDDYAAEARIYQKNYGKESEKAKELKAQLNDARIAEQNAKNENAINSFATMASQYKDDKAKKSDIDTFRSTEISDGVRAKEGNYAWKIDTYKAMSDQEVEVYNRLAKNGKEKEAKEFLEALTPYLNARVTKSRTEASVDQSKGFLGGVGASLASSLLKPIAAIEGGIKAGLDFKQGKAIDTAAPEYFASNLSNSLRTSVAQRIEQGVYESTVGDYTYDKQGNRQLTSEGEARNNGKIAAFLYTSGMSMADMMVMMPFGATGMRLMMSSNAGVDTMLSAKNVGASDEQAMSLGLIAAGAEWIFEKYSIENLFHGNVSASTGAAMLKQGGIEGSEELFTEITNIIANESIMGSLSDYNLAVAEYVEMGLAPQDARNEALKEILLRLPQAFAGGLISGGIMGGVADISRTNAAEVNAIDTYLGNEFDDHLTDYTKKAREEAMAAYLETGMTQAEAERAVAEDREDISKRASEMREEERNAYVSDKTRRAEAEAMLTEAYREDASDREGIAGKVAKNKGSLGRQVMANTDADIADAVEAAKAKYEAEGKTPDQVKSLAKRFEKGLRRLATNAQNATSTGGRRYWTNMYNKMLETTDIREAEQVIEKVEAAEAPSAVQYDRASEQIRRVSDDIYELRRQIKKAANPQVKASLQKSLDALLEQRNSMTIKTGITAPVRAMPGVTVAGEHKAGDFGIAMGSNRPDTNGVIRDFVRTLTANQRNTVGVLDQFSRSLGRSIRLVENLNEDGSYNVKDKNGNYVDGNANGLFNRATGEYFISLNSMGEGYTYIAMHESVHDIAKNATEEYAKLHQIVFEELDRHGYDTAQMVADRMKQYGETEDVAIEEVLANTVPSILQDAETANQLVDRILEADEQTKSSFLRFIDTLKEYFEMAYNALKGSKDWKQMDAISKDLDAVNRIREQYLQGLETIKAQNTETSTLEEKGEDNDLRASLMQLEDGTKFVQIDQDQDRFEGKDESEYPRIAKQIMREKFRGKVVGIENRAYITGDSVGEYSYPSKWTYGRVYLDKMRASSELDNLIEAGRNFRNEKDGMDGHTHPEAVGGFDKYDTLFKVGGRWYEGIVNIMVTEKGKQFKDVTKIKDVTKDILDQYGENPQAQFLSTSSINNISKNQEDVNEEIRTSRKDSSGNTLSEQQAEYFKDSKVRDAKGNLRIVYHGTYNSNFTVFKRGDIGYHFGNRGQAQTRVGTKGVVGSYYLNIVNPWQVTTDFGSWDGDFIADRLLNAYYDSSFNVFNTEADINRLKQISRMPTGKANQEFRSLLIEKGYDGIKYKNFHEGKGYSFIALKPEQIKKTDNKTPTDSPDIRLSAKETEYNAAIKAGDTTRQQQIVDESARIAMPEAKTIDVNGNLKHFYHGTARTDRVGYVFRPDRATSGPMAYFTDDKGVAQNYAKGKQDTSMANDPDYDMYETQFRVKSKEGSNHTLDMPIGKAWGYIPIRERNNILKKAGQLRFDWDGDDDSFILDPTTNEANGGFQWQLKSFKGNVVNALVEQWLNSGNLFNEEGRFLEVLEQTGITEQLGKVGLDVYWKDPKFRAEGVYEVFLNLTNPFNTDDVSSEFAQRAAEWWEEQDTDKYDPGDYVEADPWDKRNISMEDWIDRLKDDLSNNTTHAWTQIPDAATDYLKSLGYDGILDKGGKYSDYSHQVAIPFYSEQIKSAEPITYDASGNVIPLSKRFDSTQEDIRFSRQDAVKGKGAFTTSYSQQDFDARDLGKINAPDPDIGSISIEAEGRNEYQQSFIDDFNHRHVTPAEPANTTSYTTNKLPPHITAALRDKKRIEREYNALKESTHLSSDEMDALDALYKGGYSLDEAIQAVRAKYSGINVSEAADYYNMYERYMDNQRAVSNFNRQRKAELFETAQTFTADAINWQDKKTGIQYARETMERNNFDIMSHDEAEAINSQYFAPVHENEANNTRWKKDLIKRMNDLKLNKWESKYVHALINEQDLTQNRMGKAGVQEALDYTHDAMNKLLKSHGQLIDVKKCRNAVPKVLEIFRDIYTDLTDAEIRNGYAATEFYNTYAPNISDDSNLGFFERIAQSLGFEQGDMRLPTDLAGLTAGFKPGKPWFQYSLSRHSHMTAFDIHKAFDQYIRGAGNVVWHTDDIQRLRSLETAIRYQFSEEGIRKQIMQVLQDGTLDPDEQFEKIQQLSRSNKNLGNYVTNLTEYTNLLAGKKSIHDRGAESDFGRAIYRIMNNVQGRVAGNVIGGNISVALSNFIPLTQALSGVRADSLAKAMLEAGGSFAKDDGFDNQSTFLTNRQKVNGTYRTTMTYVDDALSVPFNAIDRFVSSSMVRARYAENIERGMSHEEAMLNADTWAASVIADRSKGALPTIFGRTNPIAKLFLMFQTEANNQLSYMAKDVVRDTKELNPTASTGQIATFVAGRLFAMFLAAFGYNKLREYVGLTENAFDPISWIEDVYGEVERYKEGDQTRYDTVKNITKETADQIPFVGGFLGGEGRYSVVQSALPKVGDIIQAYETDQQNEAGGKYFKSVLSKELQKPLFYYLLPTAGGQIKKTKDGLVTVIKGGSETVNKQGETILQYPVEKSAGNLVKAAVFGKSTLPEAKAWVESGFDSLSPKQTEMYREFEGAGGETMDFITYQKRYDELTKEIGKSNKQISEKTKEIAAANPMLTDAEAKERAQKMLGLEYRNADNEFMLEIQNSSMTDLQKLAAISAIGYSDDQIDTIRGLMDNGISVSDYLKYDRFYRDRGNTYTEDKNALVSALMADSSLSESQKTMLANKLIDGDWIVDFSSQAANDILTKHGKNAYANYKEAKAEGGLTAETYLQYENTVDHLISDYDAYGTSISYSKKAKIVNYLDSLNVSESQKEWMFYNLFGYTSKYEARHKSLKQIDGVWCYNHDGKWIKPSY